MIIQPMTSKEEADVVVPFKNDLVLLFNEIRKEMKNRIKEAATPQEALAAISILDEPYEEEDGGV
ncbi:MAG: hypothetical protein HDQ88_03695 [Clostridia bacterium]|nr:hypothetical protein [Clostridia bacterium]